MGKVVLIHYLKNYIYGGQYVLEQKIYVLEDAKKFPDGVKYSLLLFDRSNGKKVLMDNHYPKSHHVHLDENEFEYNFTSVKRLVEDFKKFVYQHLGVKL